MAYVPLLSTTNIHSLCPKKGKARVVSSSQILAVVRYGYIASHIGLSTVLCIAKYYCPSMGAQKRETEADRQADRQRDRETDRQRGVKE